MPCYHILTKNETCWETTVYRKNTMQLLCSHTCEGEGEKGQREKDHPGWLASAQFSGSFILMSVLGLLLPIRLGSDRD